MILIVGGAGYIGAHTNKYLSKKGYKTLVLDNLSRGYKKFVRWGDFVLGDLGDQNQLDLIFENYEINTVMHFGAFAYVGESVKKPGMYYGNNTCSTRNLIEAMIRNGVKNFIFSSTCAIYGEPENIPIDESEKKKPINPYGRSKLAVEWMLEDYANANKDFHYIALRYFNAAGADPEGQIGEAHDPETHLIPLVIDAAIGKRDDIKIFGTDYNTRDGTCIRDYIHVNDLADAHLKASEYLQENKTSNYFNLGVGEGFSVREIIDGVRRVSGKDFKVVETDRRPGDPAKLISNSSKAKKILKWKPTFVDINDILKTAWNWHCKK